MKLNVDAHLFCLGTFSERYVPNGYFDELSCREKLEIISKAGNITGLNVTYPTGELPADPVALSDMLKEYGLKVSYILVTNYLEGKYKQGAFCTTEKEVRKDSIEMCKRGIDFAKTVGADSVLLWPAQDGYDYTFQVNYYDAWESLVEAMQELAEYAGDFKLAVEPKPKDPRQKMLVNSTSSALNLIHEINRPNFGAALDIGHSIASQENIAFALTQLVRAGKLFQIHLNDNYKDADPDMVVGTVNFFETLEFFYYLVQTSFEGWCSIDIIAPREDRAESLRLASDMVQRYKKMADKLLKHDAVIKENLKGYHFTDNMDLIWNVLFEI